MGPWAAHSVPVGRALGDEIAGSMDPRSRNDAGRACLRRAGPQPDVPAGHILRTLDEAPQAGLDSSMSLLSQNRVRGHPEAFRWGRRLTKVHFAGGMRDNPFVKPHRNWCGNVMRELMPHL